MNPANQLTVFRVLLIPFFLYFLLTNRDMGSFSLFFMEMETNIAISMALFIIASFTDWLDGYLARKYHYVTDFGKFMDPLADKVLVMAALVGMTELQWIPSWVVIVILTREFAVTGLRLLVSSEGEVLAAKWLGKVKTAIQMVTLILFFIAPYSLIASICLYITVAVTVYSGWDYFKSYLPRLNPNH